MNPCLLIPIFDHGSTIASVVESLAPFGLECLIVDDGSAAATRQTLERIEKEFPFARILRRSENGGRGAALKTGYRWAAELGFSHAIQLDADAQHDASDVPRFLEAIAACPQALVLGEPIFDESIPKGRLYGRQISRAMVWFLTASFDVNDPLCGFRAVPLEAVVALLDEVETGDHMEFDPELVVALYWRGTPVCNVPTRVRYDPEGLSHFDVVWDDLRLVGVYSRFTFAWPFHVRAMLERRMSSGEKTGGQ